MVDQALNTVGGWIAWLLAFVLGVFAAIEDAMRRLMDQLHIAQTAQTLILVLVAVALIIVALRLFGGIFRVLLTVFLVLLLIHIVMHGHL